MGNCHKIIFTVSNTFCVRSLSVFSTFKDFGVFGSFYDKSAIISSDLKALDMEQHNTYKAWFKIMMIKKGITSCLCHYYGSIIFLTLI